MRIAGHIILLAIVGAAFCMGVAGSRESLDEGLSPRLVDGSTSPTDLPSQVFARAHSEETVETVSAEQVAQIRQVSLNDAEPSELEPEDEVGDATGHVSSRSAADDVYNDLNYIETVESLLGPAPPGVEPLSEEHFTASRISAMKGYIALTSQLDPREDYPTEDFVQTGVNLALAEVTPERRAENKMPDPYEAARLWAAENQEMLEAQSMETYLENVR